MATRLKAAAAKGGFDVVFIGDSITQGWTEEVGRPTWDREFAPLKSLNLGIGGDRTNQLLWRIDDGGLTGLDPKLVVLNIGVNNFWTGDHSPDAIADGVSAVVARIRKALPKATVLNIGILPTQATPDNELRKKAAAINAILAKRADGETVRYLDVSSAFVGADGTLPASLMPDMLHPNAAGYAAYGAALGPVVRKLLQR